MSETLSANEALCLQALREMDRDRYLASLLSPADRRSAVTALYAYNAELARIRDVAREPLPGEIRLQYWRDLLGGAAHGETSANPVASELLRAMETWRLPVSPLMAMTEARIFDLYDDPMETTAMFEGYAGETAAALVQLVCLVLDAEAAEGVAEIVGHAGVALSVAGAILLLPTHHARGQLYLPTEILAAAGLDRESFLGIGDDARRSAAIEAFAGFGLDHLRKARAAGRLPKSLVAAFLPVTLAEPVLKRAQKMGGGCLSSDLRPSQWRRQLAMMRLLLTGRL